MSQAYIIAKAAQAALEAQLKAAGDAWRAIPGTGTGPMGLTPDAVKFSPEYRAAKVAYDKLHNRMRIFNRNFNKAFAADIKAERAAIRKERENAGV